MGYDKGYGHTAAEAVERITMGKVYGWMSAALALSALVAWGVAGSPALLALVFGQRWGWLALAAAELALVLYLGARLWRMPPARAACLFMLYAALNGATLSCVLLVFDARAVGAAFLATALTFGGMSAYGYTTGRSLAGLGPMLLMCLVGVLVATVVNVFLASSALDWAITYAGLFVFVGLTAYDTQKVRRALEQGGASFGDTRRVAIMGALQLYLDFVNIFLYMLRLLGSRR